MKTRIYIVTETATGLVHLVDAKSEVQAFVHVAKPAWTISLAKPNDVAKAMANGAVVEDANIQPETQE